MKNAPLTRKETFKVIFYIGSTNQTGEYVFKNTSELDYVVGQQIARDHLVLAQRIVSYPELNASISFDLPVVCKDEVEAGVEPINRQLPSWYRVTFKDGSSIACGNRAEVLMLLDEISSDVKTIERESRDENGKIIATNIDEEF